MQKLEEKVGSVAKVWRMGVAGKCGQHPEQDPRLQGTNEKSEIYTKVFYTGCQKLCYCVID
jgi:hypothetical protein